MGRPRRNRSDAESPGAGAEDEQDKAQRPTHREKGGSEEETRGQQAQEQGNQPSVVNSTDHNGNCTGSHSSGTITQNSSSMSSLTSLMDPYGSSDDYDLNQFPTPTVMSDFDHMSEFDFFNNSGPSVPSGSAIHSVSRTSHWMRPQATSVLGGVAIREQSKPSRPVATSLSDLSADTLTDKNMMLIDGLEEKPFSSFEDTFDLEQTHARGNSSQRTPSTVGKHGENGAATCQSAKCECPQIILQKLSDIDENSSDIFSSKIDVALMLEQRVQAQITMVLECGVCATKRPTVLLLLAIIIDNAVSMLETSPRFGDSRSPVENDNCNHSSNVQSPPTAPRLFRIPQVADMIGAGKNAASPATRAAADEPPLLVGSHEILAEEKNKFLKELLRGRLSSLSATLRQLMPHMQRSSPQNSNSRHGTMMMAETYKRLQLMIGRVELWDG